MKQNEIDLRGHLTAVSLNSYYRLHFYPTIIFVMFSLPVRCITF